MGYDLNLILFLQAYDLDLYGDKYVLIMPGWMLEVPKLWHEGSAPCDIWKVIAVLDTSFYIHAIRSTDHFEDVNYNGIVSTYSLSNFEIRRDVTRGTIKRACSL